MEEEEEEEDDIAEAGGMEAEDDKVSVLGGVEEEDEDVDDADAAGVDVFCILVGELYLYSAAAASPFKMSVSASESVSATTTALLVKLVKAAGGAIDLLDCDLPTATAINELSDCFVPIVTRSVAAGSERLDLRCDMAGVLAANARSVRAREDVHGEERGRGRGGSEAREHFGSCEN